jgi:hypothetical protein
MSTDSIIDQLVDSLVEEDKQLNNDSISPSTENQEDNKENHPPATTEIKSCLSRVDWKTFNTKHFLEGVPSIDQNELTHMQETGLNEALKPMFEEKPLLFLVLDYIKLRLNYEASKERRRERAKDPLTLLKGKLRRQTKKLEALVEERKAIASQVKAETQARRRAGKIASLRRDESDNSSQSNDEEEMILDD